MDCDEIGENCYWHFNDWSCEWLFTLFSPSQSYLSMDRSFYGQTFMSAWDLFYLTARWGGRRKTIRYLTDYTLQFYNTRQAVKGSFISVVQTHLDIPRPSTTQSWSTIGEADWSAPGEPTWRQLRVPLYTRQYPHTKLSDGRHQLW